MSVQIFAVLVMMFLSAYGLDRALCRIGQRLASARLGRIGEDIPTARPILDGWVPARCIDVEVES